MGINERKEIEELLSLNGFTFKRSNGPHYVYSDGLSSFALSRSPSDWRGHMNNVSDLKKLIRKAGRDFVPITYDKKQKASQEEKEMNKGFNTPRVIEPVKVAPVSPVQVPTPQQLSTPALAKEPVVKVLDEVAFAYAVARQKRGRSAEKNFGRFDQNGLLGKLRKPDRSVQFQQIFA